MTEPPEPRHPEEGDGEEPSEVPELNEILDSEWFGEMEDDMLLDRIGQGDDDRSVHDETSDEDWDLQDMAHDWRDDVEDVPVPPKLDPDALIAEAERRKKTAPPTKGAIPPMSINDDAQVIRAVAEDRSASGAAQLAASNFGDVQMPAVDRLTDASGTLQEAIGGLESNANQAASVAGGDDGQSIRGAASVAIEAFNNATALSEQARLLAEQFGQAVQAAKTAAESALAASEQFRETCSGIAGKHGAQQRERANPLSLLRYYKRNPEPFARPGPPPAPPLPLKFTCAKCGEKVHPDAVRCSRCRAPLWTANH
jgi:hypothetical protein